MLNFLVAWIITLVFIKVYLSAKKINIGINNDIISLVLSLIIVGFLNIIQCIFGFLINIIF